MSRTVIHSRNLDVTSLRPLRDQVLVEIIQQKKIGSIEIVQQKGAISYVILAKVLRVGSGIYEDEYGMRFPIELEVGDYAILMDYTGERMEIDGNPYRIMREHGLWAKVEPGSDDKCDFKSIEPRFDTIMIEPKDETTTESGTLFLPNGNASCQIRKAKVIKCGPGVWHAPSGKRRKLGVVEGDGCIFQRYAGADVKVNGKQYRLIQECDLVTGMEAENGG